MIHLTVFSQKIISGKVVDTNGEPLKWAQIRKDNSGSYQMVKRNGEFRILKPTKQGRTMSISKNGYKTVNIGSIDTISHPITIVMKNFLYEQPWRYTNKDLFPFFTISIQADILRPSFNNFESLLGKVNVDSLGSGSLGLEYAFVYRRFLFALNHGHYFHNNVKLDSTLKGDYRTFSLGSHFGYNVINSKRFMITPKIGIKWYRYRMINYDSSRKIPMEQYITNKDLDIRFNHLIGFTGVSCNYKFYGDNPDYDNFRNENYYYHKSPQITWSIGFYGGYAFKLNDKPWVYSNHNRLITDQKIKFNNFNLGVTVSLFINHIN